MSLGYINLKRPEESGEPPPVPPHGSPVRVARSDSDHALKEEVICPLCFDVYDNPLSLQCLHCYCEDCLFRMHKSTGFADSLTCPECRSPTHMGEEGIHGLRMNFKLKRIVEILSAEEKRELSRRTKPVPKPRPKTPLPLCPQHPEKGLEFYCKQCRVLICSQCVLHSHRFHRDPVPADEALKDKMAALANLHDNAETLLTKAGGALDKMSAELQEMWVSVDKDVSSVQQYFGKLQKLLSQQELEVCKVVEARASKQQKLADKQKQILVTAVEELCKHQAQVQSFIGTRSCDIRVLSEEGKVVKKLEAGMNHLAHIVETSRPRSSYHSPFSPSPEFEGMCGTVGLQTERPAAPTRHSTIAVSQTPSGKRRVVSQIVEETTRSADNSPVVQHEFNLPLLKAPDSPLAQRPRSDSLVLVPCLVVSSSSLLGPTRLMKTTSTFPCGVCVGDSNTLVVTDSKNHMISILTPTGKFLHSVEDEGKGDGQLLEPTAVICASGNIIVADRGHPPRVQVLTDAGKFLWKFKVRNYGVVCHLGEPLGLVAVDHKTFLVSDSEKACVHVYDEEGRYTGKFGDTELRTKQPAGMVMDTRGNVFIADRGNHCVWIYTCGGHYVARIGGKQGSAPGELSYPFGITIAGSGNVFISESGNHRVSVFTPGGRFVYCFGRKGSDPGQFLFPRHLCLDSLGRLVVADEQNQRLQIFDVTE